jgi:flagellar biosynthesis protein FlhB
MAEKTEEPTPKRLREARRKGQIAFSQDVPAAASFLAGVVMLALWAPRIGAEFRKLLTSVTDLIPTLSADPATPWDGLVRDAALAWARSAGPVLAALALAGVGLALAQAGFHLAPSRLAPSLERVGPGRVLKRWFSLEGFVDLAKTIVKLALVLVLGYLTVEAALRAILALHRASLPAFALTLAEVSRSFAFRAALAFVLIAAADYFFQWRRWKKGLMMTREEVRREYKEQEGDPLIKGQRRALHQELASTAIEAEVRMADAVVVNPTHLAVALRYDRERMAAPRVTAKGGGELAQKIRRIARRHDVPLVRDVPLAQALFAVDAGRYIPRELYEGVAEVLLFASRLKRETGGLR